MISSFKRNCLSRRASLSLSIKTGVDGEALDYFSCEDEDVISSRRKVFLSINFLIIKFHFSLSVLCLVLAWQAHAVEFQCEYGYRLDHGYPCQVTKGRIESDNEPVTFVGNHQGGRDDNDLKLISFSGNRHLRLHFFPQATFYKFPQLNDFSMQNCQLKNLRNGDFKGAGNLINLNLDSNELASLNATTFKGATDLQWLSLSSNFITSINKDAFDSLSKLQMLILSQNKLSELHRETFYDLVDLNEVLLNGNQFEVMPAGLFDRNAKLKRIWMQKNQLKVIEPQLFEPLKNLLFLNLEDNVCVNELFRRMYRENEQLMTDALKNCKLTPAAEAPKS